MSGRRKRTLSEGERALWELATSDVSRAAPDGDDRQVPCDSQDEQPVEAETKTGGGGGVRSNGSLRRRAVSAPRKVPSVEFDRKLYKRLSTGREAVHGRLDLHGHTVDAAHKLLLSFVKGAHASGKRTLLVITGKGRGSGMDEFNRPRDGVLRRKVPEWLSAPDLSQIVLAVVSAHDRHGGSGAYYVSLRRRRELQRT